MKSPDCPDISTPPALRSLHMSELPVTRPESNRRAIVDGVRSAFICVFLLLHSFFASGQQAADPGGAICGSVLDENGAPASHVYVIAMLQEMFGHTGGYPGTATDDAGHYCVADLSLGKYILSALDEKKGYPKRGLGFYTWSSPDPQVTLTAQEPQANLDWQIPFKAGFLRLHVSVDHPGVQAVPITFDLVVPSRPKLGYESVMTSLRTDPRDSLTILLPPGDDVFLTAMSPGYRHWPENERGELLNLRPGETRDITISLVTISH